jgi:hypothetical protein
MVNIESIREIPARNFVNGYAKNPATYIAYADSGEYFEAFVNEDYCGNIENFRADALKYFNRD